MVSGHHGGPPESPRSFSKSFTNILQNNGKIKIKQPGNFRGEPAVFFSKEEMQALAVPFRYTLDGKFPFRRPSMEVIRKFFTTLGLKSLKSVGLLHDNHVAVFINKEEDYSRLLLRSTWYVLGSPMKILKWSTDFNSCYESPVVPVWLGFPGLPLHLFGNSAIYNIASVFGTPLKVDEPTAKLSRPTVARVCVELDVSKPRNQRLWIGEEKEGFWHEVVFEKPPAYCGFCLLLGHEEKLCFAKNPSLRNDPNKKVVFQEESRVPKSSVISLIEKENGKHTEVWRKKNIQTRMAEKGRRRKKVGLWFKARKTNLLDKSPRKWGWK